MAEHIEVVGWVELQHYKDRDPLWIKLHRKLLDNYEWSRLPDASKAHLIAIWLLAARHNNRIPADTEWIAKRISASERIDLQVLIAHGFINLVQDASESLAEPEQPASLEERREEERRREERRAEPNPVGSLQEVWEAHAGLIARVEFEKHVTPVLDRYGFEKSNRALKYYVTHPEFEPPRFRTPKRFAAQVAECVRMTEPLGDAVNEVAMRRAM